MAQMLRLQVLLGIQQSVELIDILGLGAQGIGIVRLFLWKRDAGALFIRPPTLPSFPLTRCLPPSFHHPSYIIYQLVSNFVQHPPFVMHLFVLVLMVMIIAVCVIGVLMLAFGLFRQCGRIAEVDAGPCL